MKSIVRLLALTLAAAGPAAAHQDPFSDGWCRGGEVVEVETFDIPGPVLDAFRQSPVCAFETVDRDCGVFDDDYYAARSYSAAYCVSAAADLIQAGNAVSVIPVVTGPDSFLGSNHHGAYRATSGLRGLCLACRTRSHLPTLPGIPSDPTR
ncbi:MAG TPA: hypothetical protein VMR06_00310 [Dokdonella sp.]|uniref:hypothetical protein n=1 Tax=Dokdonella sp. TaxID=2291710 RepID=UPI002CFE56B7|nr:hypothetical protein [Dokdonella sp.]HUD40422.1 hypothetical protein [Dokdonella sp.]